jgi:hypothetical protein
MNQQDNLEDLVAYQTKLRMQLNNKQIELWEVFYKQEPSYKYIDGLAYYAMMKAKYDRVFKRCMEVKESE